MREIVLTQGKVALVSDEDYEELSKHKWHARYNRGLFYACRTVTVSPRREANVYMHQVVCCKGADHKDGNGLNNQRDNLRPATHQQNQFNRGPRLGSCSRFKGVYRDKDRKKWRACIRISGSKKHIGYFDDELKAATAYDDKARELFGEFAWLNFPTDRTQPQTAYLGELSPAED